MTPGDLVLERSLVLFQASVTLGIAGLFLALFHTYRKRYFGIWGGAWSVYALRLAIIALYLTSRNPIWLFWHQVATGWTTLLLLWAALVFARQLAWDRRYYLMFAVPVLWSYVAIYRIQNFLWAALPAVLFLSLVTLGTGVVFLQYWRSAASKGAAVLAVAFLLWGAHHLDYTFLRARGAWVPYGYYLDLLFELAVGGGMLLLVLEDQHRGMAALSTLSGDLQRSLRPADVVAAVLERPLALPPVVGCALYREADGGTLVFRGGSGACAHWGRPRSQPPPAAIPTSSRCSRRRATEPRGWSTTGRGPPRRPTRASRPTPTPRSCPSSPASARPVRSSSSHARGTRSPRWTAASCARSASRSAPRSSTPSCTPRSRSGAPSWRGHRPRCSARRKWSGAGSPASCTTRRVRF